MTVKEPGRSQQASGGEPAAGLRRTLRERLAVKVLHPLFLLKRPMILGVRAAAFDASGRVFLVRHTYVSGWHLPGGGVERGETAGEALEKELREEGNLAISGKPQLFHVYFNNHTSKRDHVVFYRVEVTQTSPRKPDREIVECGFSVARKIFDTVLGFLDCLARARKAPVL